MKTYKERANNQLDEWVKGNSIHNDVDNECCPDFSCCNSKISTPIEIRETFRDVNKKAGEEEFNPDHHPWDDAKMAMLMNFLGGSIATLDIDKKVYIAGEDVRQEANKN